MHISKVDLLGWIIYSMHKNIRTSILLYEIILPPYILHIYFCTASHITYTFHANTIQSTNSFWSSPLLALHTHLELHDSAAYLFWTPWTQYLMLWGINAHSISHCIANKFLWYQFALTKYIVLLSCQGVTSNWFPFTSDSITFNLTGPTPKGRIPNLKIPAGEPK